MTQADAEAALGTIHACGIRNVVFGGGEPFAWPGNLLALAQHAKARGFTVQAGTNGINLPEDYAALDCIDRYVLPLDAAHAPLHNALRRYRNRHHQLITERLAVLKHAGKSVTISTVVTARNAAHLPELGAWLRAYYADGGQLHAWHLYKFIPQGRGGRPNAPQLHLDPKTYHHHCDHTRTHPFPFPVYKRPDMFRSRTVSFFWREQGRLWTSTPTHHSSLLTPNS
ncbi:MAG: radical SAM protein [Candidatus Hydrogenedentes bacterium]|nr:radical SAM protein [Candidatus Hydrogenedentota bacterium]